MTARVAPSARRRPCPPAVPVVDPPAVEVAVAALDEALDHIGDLAERLWAVRRLHRPAARRGLLRARVRCAGCGQASPCPTLQAVDPAA